MATEDLSTSRIAAIGIVGVLLLLVLILGTEAFFGWQSEAELAMYDNAPTYGLENLKAAQLEKINQYRWVDREKQLVAIPIDQAMQIMVQTAGKLPTTQP